MDVTQFFSPSEQDEIKIAIAQAELNTSGEIRVHLENYCFGKTLKRASKIFRQLRMRETEKQNGVLFYLAVKNRKLAIIGDEGIHLNVKQTFWDEMNVNMLKLFAENKFKEGLIFGILATGEKLKEYFPHDEDDVNELPDEISFGK